MAVLRVGAAEWAKHFALFTWRGMGRPRGTSPGGIPDWDMFRDGCPGGESPDQVGARADRVIERVRRSHGNLLLFSSGRLLRVLAARWLGLQAAGGRYLLLSNASLSALGYEDKLAEPVIRVWNETSHLEPT
jgi:broad specificity phosphatase PhoE